MRLLLKSGRSRFERPCWRTRQRDDAVRPSGCPCESWSQRSSYSRETLVSGATEIRRLQGGETKAHHSTPAGVSEPRPVIVCPHCCPSHPPRPLPLPLGSRCESTRESVLSPSFPPQRRVVRSRTAVRGGPSCWCRGTRGRGERGESRRGEGRRRLDGFTERLHTNKPGRSSSSRLSIGKACFLTP